MMQRMLKQTAFTMSAALALAVTSSALGTEMMKLLPDDGGTGDQFGHAVDVSGTTAIVGTYHAEAAYLFDALTGTQLFKLTSDDGEAGDDFGLTVAIDGTTAIVSARGDDDNGTNAGAAYLFDIRTGQQLHKLLPSDGSAGEYFSFIAISGQFALAGTRNDDVNGVDSGSMYVFDVDTGEQLHKLLPDDGATDDFFGTSVDASGTIAILGAPHNDDLGEGSGSAYLFDLNTGAQLHKLLPDDGAAGDQFGYGVAVNGSLALVGAPYHDTSGEDAGAAYLFDVITGTQIAKFDASDAASGDWFGFQVSIDGTMAVVTAPRDDDKGTNAGAAYLFDLRSFAELAKITADDGAAWDELMTVALSGQQVVLGSFHDDDLGSNSGSAYLGVMSRMLDACPQDLTGDGVIDADDLFQLLGKWGTCP